jgi:hypothetical protein
MSPRIDAALAALLPKTAGINLGRLAKAVTPPSAPIPRTPLPARQATQAASVRGMPSAGGAPRPKPKLTWATPPPAPVAPPAQSGGAATISPDFIRQLLGVGGNVAAAPLNFVLRHPRRSLMAGAVGGGLYGLKQLGDGVAQRAESGFINANNRR